MPGLQLEPAHDVAVLHTFYKKLNLGHKRCRTAGTERPCWVHVPSVKVHSELRYLGYEERHEDLVPA